METFDEVYALDNDEFQKKYDPKRKIGAGGFGKVFLCQDIDGGEEYAVKIITMTGKTERKRREVENMRRLPYHPNIISFVESFTDSYLCAIVMEYCPGRDLFDHLDFDRKWLSFPEHEARSIFAQLASALAFLHEHNEVHRDIKPENILVLSTPNEKGELIVKLLDFGVSKYIGEGGAAPVTVAGTLTYMAPEIVRIRAGERLTYGPSCDCWSLGVLLYVLLFSTTPEFINSHLAVRLPPTNEVKVGVNPIGAQTRWHTLLSDGAKDLLAQLLVSSPADCRLSMRQSLMHPWVQQTEPTVTHEGKSETKK